MNNLLQQGDFHIFSFDKKKYVFLSGSQQILEISNPTMDAYFKRCAGRDDGNALGDTTIDKVTETLKSLCTVPSACCEKQKQDMLTLNITHGCNMSCNVKLLKLYLAIENTLYLCIKDKINNEKSYRLYSCFY